MEQSHITLKWKMEGFDDFTRSFKREVIEKSKQGLTKYRGEQYKDYVEKTVRAGQAGIKPISPATRILTGEHNPMSLTGRLAREMKVEEVKDKKGLVVDVGYFGEMATVPPRGQRKSKINYRQLAVLHHTGYRIPLKGEKGRRVRAWLAMNGVDLFGGMGYQKNKSDMWKQDRDWIHVPPRPFMYTTIDSYMKKGLDEKATLDWFKISGMFSKLNDRGVI